MNHQVRIRGFYILLQSPRCFESQNIIKGHAVFHEVVQNGEFHILMLFIKKLFLNQFSLAAAAPNFISFYFDLLTYTINIFPMLAKDRGLT